MGVMLSVTVEEAGVRRMMRCQAYKAGMERRIELNLRTTACPAAVLTSTLAPVRTTRQEQESSTLYTTQAVWEGGAISNKGGSVGLTITLGKQRNLFWMQLSRQKFGWKKDPDAALDTQ